MRKMARSAHALLLPLVAIACAPAARQPAASPAGGVVHVAPPTGERETDRASILAALKQVELGGTVQFAAGTYLVGEIIPIATPRLTLLGDPAGTTLRACGAGDFAAVGDAMIAAWTGDADARDPSHIAKVRACDLLQLTGGHATVRNLTFEQAWTGLTLGCCEDERGVQQTEGDYLVEDNTFRDIINGVRGILWAPDPSVIRGNRFINTYHALAAFGSRLHVLDNQVSVPDPARVSSIGHAGFAITLAGGTMVDLTGQTSVPCDGNIIAGNRIEGHPDGIILLSTPGATCRRNEIRDNTIVVATPSFDPDSPVGRSFDAVDGPPSIITGVPLGLYTLGDPRENANGMEATVIEANTVTGAIGVGIELVRASGNRVANNAFTGIRIREPFPGHFVGFPPHWADGNGSGIWISPGSDGNEIVGNTFTDIAAHAVVLEGDSNVVEIRGADAVHDLGSGNRMTSIAAAQDLNQPTHQSRSIRVDGELLQYLDFGGEGLPVLFTAGSRPAETWAGFAPRFVDRNRVIAITHRGVPPSEGQETGYVQSARDILALLDSLGFERAVLVGSSNPAPVLIYIAEHHPERVAGFVFLAPASEAGLETVQDPSGAMQMVERAFLSTQGRDPDDAGGLDDGHLYRPRYFESGGPGISIPALTFVNRDGTRGLERVIYPLQVAELVAAGTLQVPDSVARSYFERLAEDADLQREVQAAWNTVMAAPMIANEQAFARAFGENLRIVQLDVPLMDGVPVVTGYEYRDAPDLIEADIRQFLAEMTAREADTVHVAPPAGSHEADRASILAALGRVPPGGTVQFAAGTYRLGGRTIIAVPGVTLLGSAAGTTLRGCDPADLVAYDDPALRSGSCAGLELTGARQTVRNLTFEHITWASLTIIGGRDGNALLPATTGGHLIEGNTFRDSDSFNVISDASEPIVIRDNTFINTYHAVAIQGRNVHFLDNIISAPEPGRIPYGRADIAIGIAKFAPTGPRCEDNLVVGNRIDGHPEGIAIGVFAPGASCRGNIVRDNTITVGRAILSPWERRAIADWTPWARTDSVAVGVAVRLLNYPRACEEAPPGLEPGPMCPPGGSGQVAVLSDNLIHGNRLLGGEGIAIEILYGSGNRLADNTIVGVRSWEQFPSAVLRHPPGWARANGSGIWLSPGSDENEIVGNTFEDVASDAVVIEGDRNRVETRSEADAVRDLGSGNIVRFAPGDDTPPTPRRGES